VVTPKECKIQLIASNGFIVDARKFSPSECIRAGFEIWFACHRVKVYDRLILRDQKLLISHSLMEVKLSSDHDRIVDKNPIDPSSMELHASHIRDLDVSNGIFF
jgi:hypothetical protein